MTVIVIASAVVVLAYCGYLGRFGRYFGMRRQSKTTSALDTDASDKK